LNGCKIGILILEFYNTHERHGVNNHTSAEGEGEERREKEREVTKRRVRGREGREIPSPTHMYFAT